ncbi:MAG: SdiA-regulated domain-containing protein [Bacteroidales bacterium]
MILLRIAFFLSLLNYLSTGNTARLDRLSGYDINKPYSVSVLPENLVEISGITSIDSVTIALVQDESGTIFVYDTRKKQLVTQMPFAGPGDYEGIAKLDRKYFVLRSDGLLYEISDFQSNKPVVRVLDTKLPAKDNEGLCYDPVSRNLILACKEGYEFEDVKNKQLVYSYEPISGKLSEKPILILDIKAIRKLIKENKIKVPGIEKDKLDDLKFRTSDIGFNPVTGKYYLLAASDYLMLVVDRSGKIDNIVPLDRDIFRKAEGITFNSRGDMFISNEGDGKQATILRFRYHGMP